MPDLLERLKSALADRYAVESEIGRGGMATVFLAEDLKHRRKVAIKVLHPELAASLGTDRFLREIEIVAGLEHTHILALIDSGEADGLPYYVMPYVEGESLRERLEREGPLPVDQALSIAVEVADGLAYAHEHGVVHRDIKPGNILLSVGHARIADFGVARALGVASEGEATLTGLAVGTPKYMSPEQAAGTTEIDGRSDIYALGCVLYEMLAGDPPFDGPTPQAILARKSSETAPDLRVRRKSVPPDVEAVIARAMVPAPADRFSTATEFAAALMAPELLGAPRRRRRALRRVAGAGVAIGMLVAGIWLTRPFRGPGPSEDETVELDPDAIAVMPFRVVGTSAALRSAGGDIPDLFWIKVTGEYGPRTVDPGTVNRLWAAAGGSVDTPLSEAETLEIAGAVGAGRLVRGVVAGDEANMTLTATLLEAPDGRVRVRQTTVEGPYEDYEDYVALVDMLINQLLASAWGVTADRLPELTAHPPAAVQAFLLGRKAHRQADPFAGDSLLKRALELDSTFVLAPYTNYLAGEYDIEQARFAWEHQDQLSPRDQARLRGLAGWLFGETRTVAERVAQFDSAGGQTWESDAWWNLHTFGRLAEIPRWRERSKAALLHSRRTGSRSPLIYRFLFEIAADEGDTTAMRLYSEDIARFATNPWTSLMAVAAKLHLALLQGDTNAADSLWEQADALGAARLKTADPLVLLLLYGRGLPELDHFMLSQLAELPDGSKPLPVPSDLVWARARGRYPEWSTIRERLTAADGRRRPLVPPITLVRDALFLGEPEDSSVLAAAARLDSVAIGTLTVAAERNDPTPEFRGPALARCWSTLWKVAHGDTETVRETVRYLREDVPLPYRYSVCAGIIEVQAAEQAGGDVRSAVFRLDSIVRPVPMEPPMELSRDGTHLVDNLFLSRKLVQAGDTLAALAAARRAKPFATFSVMLSEGIFVEQLREEARLAAMVGDTAGAIDAYQQYFALRDFRPDHPPWAAQWDSMRVEYGALTGVEGP